MCARALVVRVLALLLVFLLIEPPHSLYSVISLSVLLRPLGEHRTGQTARANEQARGERKKKKEKKTTHTHLCRKSNLLETHARRPGGNLALNGVHMSA